MAHEEAQSLTYTHAEGQHNQIYIQIELAIAWNLDLSQTDLKIERSSVEDVIVM